MKAMGEPMVAGRNLTKERDTGNLIDENIRPLLFDIC